MLVPAFRIREITVLIHEIVSSCLKTKNRGNSEDAEDWKHLLKNNITVHDTEYVV